jgi:hypothetical protein
VATYPTPASLSNFYVIWDGFWRHAPKTIYYGHVTSLQLGPLLPLEMYVLLMNVCDMHEKVSSFERDAIINENNINFLSMKK